MKKSALFLVLCLPVITFVACNKSNEEPEDTISGIYVGETEGFHDSQHYDHVNDTFIRIKWDTTYADFIKVEIDHTTQKIKFTMVDIHSLLVNWRAHISEFDYISGTTSYHNGGTPSYMQYFNFKQGDSLFADANTYGAGGTDFMQKRMAFKGKKVQ